MTPLTSRDNPRVRRWAKLVQDARLRRAEKRALIEGPHLLQAFLDAGGKPVAILATEAGLAKHEIATLVRRSKTEPVVVSDSVFQLISDAETPQGLAAEIAIPDTRPDLATSETCVFLEGIQDAGNVGSILRSAVAFGVRDIVLSKGCADVWSPKVLRAAAGAHFHLKIEDQADLLHALVRFGGRAISTLPKGGVLLPDAHLDGRIGWIFGGEGQGISQSALRRASSKVSIPTTSESESLNVAVAASICFYETSRNRMRSDRDRMNTPNPN